MFISISSSAWGVEEEGGSYDLSSGIRYDMIASTGESKGDEMLNSGRKADNPHRPSDPWRVAVVILDRSCQEGTESQPYLKGGE